MERRWGVSDVARGTLLVRDEIIMLCWHSKKLAATAYIPPTLARMR
jgi:hypothetical protein